MTIDAVNAAINSHMPRPPRCEHPSTSIKALIKNNGVKDMYHVCDSCNLKQRGIKYSDLPECTTADDYPVFRDNRDGRPCEVCGDTSGVERHHYAPRHIFGFDEADRWPTGMLCVGCHRRWHQLTRTGSWYDGPKIDLGPTRWDNLKPATQLTTPSAP